MCWIVQQALTMQFILFPQRFHLNERNLVSPINHIVRRMKR